MSITHHKKYTEIWMDSTHVRQCGTGMPQLQYTLWGKNAFGEKCIDVFFDEKEALKAYAAWEDTL